MKHIYLRSFIFFMVLQLSNKMGYAQCPWGFVPSGTAYDTTVNTGSGNYSTVLKFPKFDPQDGMVVCVRLCLTVTGIVTMALENNVTSPATYDISYNRKDTISGPALSSPMTNQALVPYGPYNLAASDGVPFSGPDFVSIGPDTILQSFSMCRTITDTADLSQFYGHDSVTYNYSINAGAVVTGSGDYLFSVATTGIVNYRLEYCYCPAWILPLSITQFDVTKTAAGKADIKWAGLEEANKNFHYEVEVSRNSYNFISVGSIEKNQSADYIYKFLYSATGDGGFYFFRIKQVYSNGYTLFTGIKSIELERAVLPRFTIYPNPSSGIVGIKFDDTQSGKIIVLITNAQGQSVVKKEFEVLGSSYRQIATLQRGIYWLRLTDVTSHLSCVNQLFIK